MEQSLGVQAAAMNVLNIVSGIEQNAAAPGKVQNLPDPTPSGPPALSKYQSHTSQQSTDLSGSSQYL